MVQGMVKVKEKQPTKRSPTTEGEWDAALYYNHSHMAIALKSIERMFKWIKMVLCSCGDHLITIFITMETGNLSPTFTAVAHHVKHRLNCLHCQFIHHI
ncbi:hypothetical protein F7725_006719 [Dissostichus mawsoni]|uniref:Uncharacterized protein n=1 Tax=Dissostichus mawsoni TaxID=36200 RepID=A0A7J5XWA3_DISMA|nr:hypothetical protein F7725_006719 [Dissostichus mawsoni]